MTSRMDLEPVRTMVRRSMPTPSPRGGKAVAEGADVVLVHGVGLVVAAFPLQELGLRSGRAGRPIVQLTEGVPISKPPM